jgi:hypothetical protein
MSSNINDEYIVDPDSILDVRQKVEKPQSLACIKICLAFLCLGTLAGIIALGMVLSSTIDSNQVEL